MGLKSCAFVVAVIGGSLVAGPVLLGGASGLVAALLLSLSAIPLVCFLLRNLLPSKQNARSEFITDGGLKSDASSVPRGISIPREPNDKKEEPSSS